VALPEDTRAELRKAFGQLMVEGVNPSVYLESEVVTAKGARRLIAWHNLVRRDAQGRPLGTLSSGIDITDRIRLLEAAAHNEKLKSLAVLAGGIAHDFNNLLTSLFGNLELARESGDAGVETREYLGRASQALARAQGLTHQLLTFSRGGHPIRKAISLPPLIKDTVEFALSGSALRRDYRLPNDLRDCSADSVQLAQVFENLAINAQDALQGAGTLFIEADNVDLPAGEIDGLDAGAYVAIVFRDTGPGVPAYLGSRIFDPFFTTKPHGTGLGLASAHSIVERHGGRLTLDSVAPSGAAFRLYLPASEKVPEAARGDRGQPVRKVPGCRLLVMDDEESVLEMVCRLLSRIGYDVSGASDGAAALAAVRSDPSLRLAILDLTVKGGMGGAEAAKHIRAVRPDIPIVASSGYAEDPILAEPRAFGFDAALPKPFGRMDLERLLQDLLKDS
jgi:signal transduction histidine kinase